MKKLSFFLMAMLFSVMSFAVETVAYTLTPAATGGNSSPHNAYASAADWTYEGITWNVTGNSYMVPWRIGGKSLTAQDRAVYTKTAMAADITKIEITHATVNITCNSCTLTVSDAANGAGESIIRSYFTFFRSKGWRFYRCLYFCVEFDFRKLNILVRSCTISYIIH